MTEPATTLLHTFVQRAELHGGRVALRELSAGGATADVALTWGEWAARARAFAYALRARGCQVGDHVAILAGNSIVWPIAEIGAQMVGAVTVGLYPTSAPAQVHEILNDCAACVVVTDTRAQLAKVQAVRDGLPALRCVVCAEPAAEAEMLEDWLSGEELQQLHDPAPQDVALLIYTSGSTGEPKGARISHRYLSASAASIQTVLGLSEHDSSLSFLPYCHAAERVFGLYTRIHAGMSCGLVANHQYVWPAARSFQPTLFGGLPRFYEKLYEQLHREFGTMTPTAVPAARQRITEHLGGRVRVATSGGATLPVQVTEYLAACGLQVLGAYGLSEHLCAAMHRPGGAPRYQAVGQEMPGTQLRIGDGGAILIRKSALTFSGYHTKPDQTRAAFTADGEWLRTGDTGYLDSDGFLFVTGREKDLIALSTGKKVAPLPIEAKLSSTPLISQAVLVGENRKYITALIALRPAVVQAWAERAGLAITATEAATHPEVLTLVQQEVDRVNADLSRTEQIRRFLVLPHELSVERDELTPTLKIRRNIVSERYRSQLESLYPVGA